MIFNHFKNKKNPRSSLPVRQAGAQSASSAFYWKPPGVLSALVYLIVGILVFHQVFSTWFLSDDLVIFNLISFNPFGYVEDGFFRPLTDFTNYLTFLAFGYEALPYKVTNLLLHIANSYLVMLIAGTVIGKSTLLREKSFYNWLPFLAGLMFLIWPIRSESVFWGAGRASSLAFFFFAISLLGYFRYRNKGSVYLLSLAFLSFFVSLFCYESVFSVPLVILAVELWLRYEEKQAGADQTHTSWLPVIGFFVVLIVYLGFRYGITGEILGGYGGNFHAKVNSNIFRNILVYPFKMMIGAAFFSKQGFIILAGALTVIFGGLKFYYFRKTKWKIPGLWFFLMLTMYLASLPVLNLSMGVADTQFDRYLYLPSLFMTLVLVSFISTFIDKKRTFFLVFGILSVYAISTSFVQSTHWKKASLEVKKTLNSINSLEKKDGHLILLNLPDHYCGAYLLRNGIHEGIKFLCPDTNFKSVHLIGMHPIYSIDDEVAISSSADLTVLSILNPVTSLEFEEKSSEFFKITTIDDRQFKVEFQKLGAGDAVVYWSAGEIRLLNRD